MNIFFIIEYDIYYPNESKLNKNLSCYKEANINSDKISIKAQNVTFLKLISKITDGTIKDINKYFDDINAESIRINGVLQ